MATKNKGQSKAFDYSRWPNWIDPADVIPYEKNAKVHDAEREFISRRQQNREARNARRRW